MKKTTRMNSQIVEMPSIDCFCEIAKAVPKKRFGFYTKKDMDNLITESLFHNWECGTLADQQALACAVIYVAAQACDAVISKFIKDGFEFFRQQTGALK